MHSTHAARALLFLLIGTASACAERRVDDDDGEYEGDEAGECEDGADNDQDGDFDCLDSDCVGAPICLGDDDTSDDDTTADDDTADDDTASDDDTGSDDDTTAADDTAGDDDSTPDDPGGYLYANTAQALYDIAPTAPYTATHLANFSGADLFFPDITDIAIDTTGQMWATGFFHLYRVNPTTGALSLVGSHFDIGAPNVNALTFLADGTLLAGAENTPDLYEVDTNDGSLTSIGTIGGLRWAGDMVGLPDGLLYCLMSSDGDPDSPTDLVAYDVATAEIVDQGATGQGAMFGAGWALGTYFGFASDGSIYDIDTATGAGTLAAEWSHSFWGATTNPVRWPN